MSWTTLGDFLLGLFKVDAQSVAGRVRFFVSLITFRLWQNLVVTADSERLDIKCHPMSNDLVTQERLSR